MVITKRQDVNDQYSEENFVFGEVLLVLVHLLGWEGEGGGGWVFVVGAYLRLSGRGRGWSLFKAGRLLTFSAFGMGAY